MNREGLLVEPNFEDINKYLQGGSRTEISNLIKRISWKLKGDTDGISVRNILVWMNRNTARIHNGRDLRKFKRNATEILKSKERTGCCDSSTLFTALARSIGIPTMQIITLSKKWGEKVDKGISQGTEGHFFVASYLKDLRGKYSWVLIDTDREVRDIRDVRLETLNLEDRNMGDLYAFAYVSDYYDDLKIDSIKAMGDVQLKAYKQCNRRDFINKRDNEQEL